MSIMNFINDSNLAKDYPKQVRSARDSSKNQKCKGGNGQLRFKYSTCVDLA